MRIIHTSDWHLGQHFMGKTREKEHQAFLNWLLDLTQTRAADALVVTGDIFDTGTPPSYARTLYNEFIVSLQQSRAQAVFLGGNHDSAATLNEGKQLLAFLKTDVVAGFSDDPAQHLVMVRDRSGRPGLLVCALPYLRPKDLMQSAAGMSGTEKQAAMSQAIQACYAKVFYRARERQKELISKEGLDHLPLMATGHLTVVGGKSDASVRDIYIGSLDAFPASGFPKADYIALGHLHRAQAVKGPCCIHYSGSPLPLSFGEGTQTKQVIQVDFKEAGSPEVTPVPVPCFRRLVSIEGSLSTIERRLADMAEGARGSEMPALRTWIEAVVAADDFLTDLPDRIQKMVRKTGEEDLALLRVRRQPKSRKPGFLPGEAGRLEELNPTEVFLKRLAQEELDQDRVEILTRMFGQVLTQIQTRGDEEGPRGDA